MSSALAVILVTEICNKSKKAFILQRWRVLLAAQRYDNFLYMPYTESVKELYIHWQRLWHAASLLKHNLLINIRFLGFSITSWYTLQMFTGVYRVFAGKLKCGDFKFMGIACIHAIPVILKSPHSDFHCNICREFDLQGYYGDTPH